jgi:hypothetical protein
MIYFKTIFFTIGLGLLTLALPISVKASQLDFFFTPPERDPINVGTIDVDRYDPPNITNWDITVPSINGFNFVPYYYTPKTSTVIVNEYSDYGIPSISFLANVQPGAYLNIFQVNWDTLSQNAPQNVLMWVRENPPTLPYDKTGILIPLPVSIPESSSSLGSIIFGTLIAAVVLKRKLKSSKITENFQ